MKIDISQLKFIDSKLRSLLIWLEKQTGFEFTITSLYRISDKGVHGTLPLRGVDLRMKNITVGKEIESLINSHWNYGKEDKNCALLHGKHTHLHIQVHPKTQTKIRY